MTQIEPDRPLIRLLIAHAPADLRDGDRLIWAFDERLAQLARTTREPMIGQMRLAWWEEALGDETHMRGQGEPLLDALRDAGVTGLAGLVPMLDGWEALLTAADPVDEVMMAFAAGRGEGLFAALARERDPPAWLRAAGRLWALWDLSGHLVDDPARRRAIGLAQAELAAINGADWPGAWRGVRLLTALARHDVSRNRPASPELTPRIYARLLRIALVGR